MGEIITTLVIVILMLIVVCFIGSLALAKDTKEFHINFGWNGFEISGSFYENNNPQEDQSNL